MGSKKHKEKDRESKKKRKHRSRSRSRSREKKRRHRDRSRSHERESAMFLQKDHGYTEERNDDRAQNYDYSQGDTRDRRDRSSAFESKEESHSVQASGDGSSLSIEETNRLRAKLGLKPLDVPDKRGSEEGDKTKKIEGVHVPAINLGQQRKTEALREKMTVKKTQREMEKKLQKIKGLGDSDSGDEGASAWVLKSRKLQQEKEMAEKRAKMLEEMDEDFGIGNLVEQEFKKDKRYTSQDLSGLTVEHALDKFDEGRNVILTLKDKGVLDEEDGDVLVNVNIEDDERAQKNTENKKQKPDYKPYDEPEYDEYGMLKPNNLLAKYDEEIEGAKKDSFTLGSGGHYDAAHEKRMAEIRQQLRAQGQSLQLAPPTLLTEYMTPEEMEASTFKKIKKKVRKIRKKEILKADDLLPLPEEVVTKEDYGSRSRGRGRVDPEDGEVSNEGEESKVKMEVDTDPTTRVKPDPSAAPVKIEIDDSDMLEPDEDLTGVVVEEEEVQNELQGMLARARKLKLKKERQSAQEIIRNIKPEEEEKHQRELGVNIVLNSTSEFCRNLGEIPTYGLAGNREEDREEIMDMELELMDHKRRKEEQEETTGGWNEVDIDENPVDIRAEEAAVLEEEPIAGEGVGAALKLAIKKGYLENENPKKLPPMSTKYLELQAQNYTIQDKRYDDLDEKNRKRDRYQGGMITEFKEKDSYKPDVKLDYVDESGRNLCAKEAFRQLSHRFHGKGSGKKKTEKRSKKVDEELLMKRMSSTDTPLNTLSLLKDKQKSEKSPYIVLSGSKGFTSNTIVKPS
ncbi:U4/U6.U5 tri-snRNP-associated protein 1-like [Physella acuta]|uniref:U4/U6.U5 tri-snRNP-associated protein 1-like n=1 Tax=Physella acuta TaxID=109671 RepID=UPI0027DB0B68|nr:U4/U6.U5 tri-snRNP-associated protein 1-like [Physella acuta]